MSSAEADFAIETIQEPKSLHKKASIALHFISVKI